MKEFYIDLKSDPDISLRVASFKNKPGSSDAKTIVIIPGYFGSIEERSILAAHLVEYFNVIIYEPRGFGKSTKKRTKWIYRIRDYAAELREVIEELALKDGEFLLFGSSLSVSFIHYYAAFLEGEKPAPAALVFVSPAPKYRGAAILRAIRFTPYWLQTVITKIIFSFLRLTRNSEEAGNLTYAETRFRELDPWVQFRIAVESVGYANFTGEEDKITYPVCVFTALQDDFTSPEDAARYAQGEKSSLVLVEAKAHKFINGREEFIADNINDFLYRDVWEEEEEMKAGS